MDKLQPVRGTRDLWPDEARRHRYIEETALKIAERYGFGELMTPIFEFTDVFARTLGETSDVVTKEMYTFTDRSGDSLTLRPEATAGIARAFINEGQSLPRPIKLFYRGPMFRHERPQKGRLRQFHQIDAEILGSDKPIADAEAIGMAWHVLSELGLAGKVTLELNSLGSQGDRAAYRDALRAYLSKYADQLSEDSRARLERNPLRILDSKDEGDRKILVDAPQMQLTEGQAFFDELQKLLGELKIPYTINPKLVRGLDYYCHTVFEFTTTQLGAQGTVLAGGRYDGLIKEMGGPPTPSIGWAAGVERLAGLMDASPEAARAIVLVAPGGAGGALSLADQLRRAGFTIELDHSGRMKNALERASKTKARAAVIQGEDERAKGVVSVRDLDAGTQEEVPLAALEERLARLR
ncbi:MAG TPA: histidine--tRNA ligase [Magnetospirillaceae bacterium]|jgi:histidyl-tRNA synthetase